MSDREALAADVAYYERHPKAQTIIGTTVLNAARERLAQLPEKCPHGCSGKVYPAELVAVVKRSLLSVAGEIASDGSFWCPDISQAAVAVLDAINSQSSRETP